jgi:BirA family biotin operon repressor/biotin-[acetyl-CoA-carboxylase] ligase
MLYREEENPFPAGMTGRKQHQAPIWVREAEEAAACPALRYFDETESTNLDAMRWSRAGAPDGAIILADHQTAGRGRMGRQWFSEPGESLLLSRICRWDGMESVLHLIPVAAGLAVADAAAAALPGAPIRLKWPNDALVDGQKVAGILAESSTTGGEPTYVVVGIGMNVGQTERPGNGSPGATSLRMAAGYSISRGAVLARLLTALDDRLEQLRLDVDGLLTAYSGALAGMGEFVSFRRVGGEEEISGYLVGVDKAGAIRLRTAAGEESFQAGEITTGVAS